jgi:hypothetical protein
MEQAQESIASSLIDFPPLLERAFNQVTIFLPRVRNTIRSRTSAAWDCGDPTHKSDVGK